MGAVVHFGLQVTEAMCHFPAYTGLNMLIAPWFGQTVFSVSVNCSREPRGIRKPTCLIELGSILQGKHRRRVAIVADRAR